MSVEDLRREYPELAEWDLTPVDVSTTASCWRRSPEESQDFIVANHFLEHCEDPIRTIETHLGKLKPGGVLFYAVPDKRYTFDFRRPVTPLEHMVADHEQGPERSRARALRRVGAPGRSTRRRPPAPRRRARRSGRATGAGARSGRLLDPHARLDPGRVPAADPPLPRAPRRRLRHRGGGAAGDRVHRRPPQGRARRRPPAPPEPAAGAAASSDSRRARHGSRLERERSARRALSMRVATTRRRRARPRSPPRLGPSARWRSRSRA